MKKLSMLLSLVIIVGSASVFGIQDPCPGYSCTITVICEAPAGTISCTGAVFCKRGFNWVSCDGNRTNC